MGGNGRGPVRDRRLQIGNPLERRSREARRDAGSDVMRCVMVQTFPRGKCEMQAVSCQTGTPLPGRASRFRRFEFDEIKKQETDGGRTRAACRLLCVSADEICRSDCLVSFPLWPSGSGALPRVPDRLARQCECETPKEPRTKNQEIKNRKPKTKNAHPKSTRTERWR